MSSRAKKIFASAIGAFAMIAAVPASAGTWVDYWRGPYPIALHIGWAYFCDDGSLHMWGGDISMSDGDIWTTETYVYGC